MAGKPRVATNNQELRASDLWRDTRSWEKKFGDAVEVPSNIYIIYGLLIGSLFIVPDLAEFALIIGCGLFFYIRNRKFKLPFRMPKTSNLLDHNDPKMGTDDIPGKANGIHYFGNEMQTQKELWFKKEDVTTHILIFGSTGAGKTETLISLAFNALVQGSGFIYVDGKGDASLFAKIFSMARSLGREDDLLVINYMTGSRDVFGKQKEKLSNTLNPFISGSSGGLTELLVSLMDESGGDGMWKGRAISLISAIMMALVVIRDKKEMLLDVHQIRTHLVLEQIIKLAKRPDLPPHVQESLKAYLQSLPGYQPGTEKQSETVLDQHGYLQMQFTRILGSLADSYGYIFKTELGEVDFWDVIVQRRILVVLLPALEKSPEELANLGKIVVACLKQMMASGLGTSLEGEHKKIIDTRPTNSETPFMCILDEYGYYAVKGAAVIPAQARSLGFCMVFAGQDYPAFEKASKEEAASTIANCNIKIFMKLEDPKDTFDLFIKSVGEAVTSKMGSMSANRTGMMSGYNIEGDSVSFEKQARGDLLDLKDQREGEAHIIFKSSVIRAKMFFAGPKSSKKYRLNYFLKVAPPQKADLENLEAGLSELLRKMTDLGLLEDINDSLDELEELEIIQTAMEAASGLGEKEKMCAVFAYYATQRAEVLSEVAQLHQQMVDQDMEEDHLDIFGKPRRFEDEDDDPVFLDEHEFKRNISEIDTLLGEEPQRSVENADKMVEDMKIVSQYPSRMVPDDKEPEDLINTIDEVLEKLMQDEVDDYS